MTMPIPSTFDKMSQYSGRAPPILFSFAAQSDLGLATHFEYCEINDLKKKKKQKQTQTTPL
jgi:hypothetical protein